MVNWKYFRSLWSVSSLFWAVPGVDHTICDESNWYSCVKNCFYTFVVDFGQKSPQTYVKWLFFNIWLCEYFSAGFWEGQGVDCIRNV